METARRFVEPRALRHYHRGSGTAVAAAHATIVAAARGKTAKVRPSRHRTRHERVSTVRGTTIKAPHATRPAPGVQGTPSSVQGAPSNGGREMNAWLYVSGARRPRGAEQLEAAEGTRLYGRHDRRGSARSTTIAQPHGARPSQPHAARPSQQPHAARPSRHRTLPVTRQSLNRTRCNRRSPACGTTVAQQHTAYRPGTALDAPHAARPPSHRTCDLWLTLNRPCLHRRSPTSPPHRHHRPLLHTAIAASPPVSPLPPL